MYIYIYKNGIDLFISDPQLLECVDLFVPLLDGVIEEGDIATDARELLADDGGSTEVTERGRRVTKKKKEKNESGK